MTSDRSGKIVENDTLYASCEKQAPRGLLLHSSFIRRRIINNLKAWMLILPAFVFLVLFTLYPIYTTLSNSLYLKNLSNRLPRYVGLENYQGLLQDHVFMQAVKNNLVVALVTIPLSIMLAIIMALLANMKLKGRGILRAGYFYPTLLPMIAVANIWLFIYTPGYGLLNQIGKLWGAGDMNLLGDPSTVLPAIIGVLIWKESGYFMIFFLAGLQNIPRDMYEAARMDGANRRQSFRHITWPLLMPTALFVLIVALTNAFKNVDHLYIMTKGGPDNASSTILYYIYQVGFEFWDTGKASAITAVLVVLLLAVTCIKFFAIDRKTHYD